MRKWRMQLLDDKDTSFTDQCGGGSDTILYSSTPRTSLDPQQQQQQHTPKKPFFSEKDITEVLDVLKAQEEERIGEVKEVEVEEEEERSKMVEASIGGEGSSSSSCKGRLVVVEEASVVNEGMS